MEISEIYNGSQWAHDILLVNKAGAHGIYHGPILHPVKKVKLFYFRITNMQATGLLDKWKFIYWPKSEKSCPVRVLSV